MTDHLMASHRERMKNDDRFALVLDVGTTGVKALVFDGNFRVVAKSYRFIDKRRPKRGRVEQDPLQILHESIRVMRAAMAEAGIRASACVGVGITNQRETVIAWDAKTGRPAYPAIVWEDVRTARACAALRPSEATVRAKTGLAVDPYFSASKIRWLLDNVPAAKRLAADGRLRVGTVDSWLVWNLCAEHPHVTDETNASRTLLFDIRKKRWDAELLALFGVPPAILPRALPSCARFGTFSKNILGTPLPIQAVCGDQQSSLHAAFSSCRGRVTKVTYGTGTFVSQSLGRTFRLVPGFFTTLVPGRNCASEYALESKISGTGEGVTRLLKKPAALRRYLHRLAKKVDVALKKLPYRPEAIVADGGIMRDGIVTAGQEKVSGVRVIAQPTFDGTALGTAHLLLD
jgi:glycerol kinase